MEPCPRHNCLRHNCLRLRVPARVSASVGPCGSAPLVGVCGAALLVVHLRSGPWRASGPEPRSGQWLGNLWLAWLPWAGLVSHGEGGVLGRPVSGSGDNARGPALGCWLRARGVQGLVGPCVRIQEVPPMLSGAECSPLGWEPPDWPRSRRVRPVFVSWWSQHVVLVFVCNAVPPAWPHHLAGGLVGQPLMVPEPPWPWMCLAVAAKCGWTRWTSWGTGIGKGSCWGRILLVGWACQG